MSERDIEKDVTVDYFVDTLRRMADAIEAGESFRIQVANTRFTVPADAVRIVEHEVEDGEEELSLELQWTRREDDED
ncbi:MAG: amphi-Trp domain-containing protein [Actinomycetota bacterium]